MYECVSASLQHSMKHIKLHSLCSPVGLSQLTALIHSTVQTPHILHDDRWNSSCSETPLFSP